MVAAGPDTSQADLARKYMRSADTSSGVHEGGSDGRTKSALDSLKGTERPQTSIYKWSTR